MIILERRKCTYHTSLVFVERKPSYFFNILTLILICTRIVSVEGAKLDRVVDDYAEARNATSNEVTEEDLHSNQALIESSASFMPETKNTTDFYVKRQEEMRQVWARTFDEIKQLVRISNKSEKTLETWKNLLPQSSPWKSKVVDRFKGYVNWERRLEQWEEEVIEYFEQKVLLESTDNTTNSLRDVSSSATSTLDNVPNPLRSRKRLKNPQKNELSLYDLKISVPLVPAPAKKGEPIVPDTDVSDKSKRIWIVTTAALPWMTGTAVNPLLRAAYLTRGRREAGGSITLLIPWLERDDDQERIYGESKRFKTQKNQEDYIRKWLRDSANMPQESEDLKIAWYTAWQEKLENSIYSMGDITALIPKEEADICVLEEPEHLNWYRAPGENWTDKFKHVVGIVHTNYFVYAQEQPAALIRAPAMRLLCSWMCRAHCHRVIKLSGTLDNFAPEKELIENVHGVRQSFLDIGESVGNRLSKGPPGKAGDPIFGCDSSPTVYFIGKMLWSKGLLSLMELMKYAEESADLRLKIDMYGGGPNKDDAEKKSKKMFLDMPFHGPRDHALLGETHKIFVNPSTSEVLCTTSAEALAMGKFVILPSHPSNDFFAQFPNCLPYATKEEFVANLYYATTHSPEPLSPEYSHALSWEAATHRFEAAACISLAESDEAQKAFSEMNVGIDIDLPPIIEDDSRRTRIVATLERTRERYRLFREKLKQEIKQQRFLPSDVQERMVSELEKRFDIDFEEFLGSPKVKVRLSPAELDKQLLDLYDSVSRSPGGDIVRIIGGGANVGAQNYYLKQQALKREKKSSSSNSVDQTSDVFVNKTVSFLPFTLSENGEPLSLTGSIRNVLRKNNLREESNNKLMDVGKQITNQDPSPSLPERNSKQRGPLMATMPSNHCSRFNTYFPIKLQFRATRSAAYSIAPSQLFPKLNIKRV